MDKLKRLADSFLRECGERTSEAEFISYGRRGEKQAKAFAKKNGGTLLRAALVNEWDGKKLMCLGNGFVVVNEIPKNFLVTNGNRFAELPAEGVVGERYSQLRR